MKKGIIITALLIAAFYFISSKAKFSKVTTSNIVRGKDGFGSGYFGAPRGGRVHEGIDIITTPGENVFAPISGKVTRFPFPYASDLSYTGIEIKNETYTVKLFYVAPTVNVGDYVSAGQIVAKAQNIAKKYGSTMINHLHIEVIVNATNTNIDYSKIV